MPSVVRFAREFGARSTTLDQCMLGAPSTKPTRILYHRGGFVLLRERCNHPRGWKPTPNGGWVHAAHESIWGQKNSEGWASKAAALYPPGLCAKIARCIAVTQPVVAGEDAADCARQPHPSA